MLFRLLFLGFMVFWAIRIAARLFKSDDSNIEVKGESNKSPLDLKDKDVQDIDYKEIKD